MSVSSLFNRLAKWASRFTGRPLCFALAVLVVNGADTSSGDYTGARLAAPIARQVIEAALQ